MDKLTEKFRRYQQEHSRLHDPEVLQSSAELIPLTAEQAAPAIVEKKRAHKGKKKKRPETGNKPVSLFSAVDLWKAFIGNVTDRELADPSKHESLAEYVRWLKIISARPTQPTEDSSFETAVRVEPEEDPDIIISPLTLSGQIELFQDHHFAVNAPGGRQVELVWRESDESASRRVVMDHQRGDFFKTNIGIADGDYLFGYAVDGWMSPDQRYAQRVVLGPDGVWGRLRLARHTRLVVLRNRGRAEELARIDSSVPWLALEEEELRLPALKSVVVAVRLLPEKMANGLNDGSLRVHAFRKTEYLTAASMDVAVTAKAGGAVPVFKYHPSEFGWIMQGKEKVQLNVEVAAHGDGALNGMVMLRHSEELADFRLDTGDAEARFRHTFVIDSSNLPYKARGALKITFVTDSYLANYRFSEVELPYGLIHLMKSLPALAYGEVRKGATRTLRLEVKRSDGQEVNLEASVPPGASHYLEALRAGHAAFSFRFDTRELEPGTRINEVITLIDRSSGLSDHAKVLAEVGGSQIGLAKSAPVGWKRR